MTVSLILDCLKTGYGTMEWFHVKGLQPKACGRTKMVSATGDESAFKNGFPALSVLKDTGKIPKKCAVLLEFMFYLTQKTHVSLPEDSNKPT